MSPRITAPDTLTVFGSINLDIAVRVERVPLAGETQLGGDARMSPGGKGANQAHAAQRFGVPVQLIGAVGDDAFAAPALAGLRASGVDLSGVQTLAGVAGMGTGLACIAVTPEGENSIVVAPGANAGVAANFVTDAQLTRTRMLLLQMEVPFAQSLVLAARARALGCKVMLNAAPMVDALIPPHAVDWLVLNRVELDQLCAARSVTGTDPAHRALKLAALLGADVALTLGGQGALIAGCDGRHLASPALAVDVVDTTGAGDTFAGVFGAALVAGLPEAAALRAAVVAASLACRHAGAQAAQPGRRQIDAAL